MNKQHRKILRLCVTAVMCAVYFVLTRYGSIRLGNLRITLASLPTILLATLFGPAEACGAAALGEFLNQVLTYGLSATTPLWLLPPVLRAVIISLGCGLIRRKNPDKPCWHVIPAYQIVLIVAALVTTLDNTGVTWLDSVIFHYYSFAYVFGDFVVRLLTGLGTAAVLSIVVVPVLDAIVRVPGMAPEKEKNV